MVGSLAGAAASNIVTGVYKIKFKVVKLLFYLERNGICLIDCFIIYKLSRCFSADHSDPVMLCGKIIDHRIKGTPGITGL